MVKEPNFSRQRINTSRLPATLAAKWSRPVLAEGFVPFPKLLLRCLPKIFTGEGAIEKLAVILAIVDFQRDELFRDPSLEYLAFVADMERDDFHAGQSRFALPLSAGYQLLKVNTLWRERVFPNVATALFLE